MAPPIGDGCSGLESRGLPFSCSVTAGGRQGNLVGQNEDLLGSDVNRPNRQGGPPEHHPADSVHGGRVAQTKRRQPLVRRPLVRWVFARRGVVQPEPNRPGRGVGRKRASPPIPRLKVL